MKKLLFSIAVALATLQIHAAADLFEIDYQEISEQFAEIQELENFLEENQGTTLMQLKESNHAMANRVQDFDRDPVNRGGRQNTMGIPPFIIGCGCGVLAGCIGGLIGVLIVSMATGGDREQVRQATLGCVVGSLLAGVIWFQLSNT